MDILALLSGQIEPVRTSFTYRFAILLVALVMILLPLIYLALIVLVVYGMYYHAIHDTGILSVARGGRAMIFCLLIYLAPLVSGAILVFFMFKPLLARPEKIGARRQNSAGIFHYEAPAAALFSDFDALARNVTWDQYRGILGVAAVKLSDLHSVDELLATQKTDSAG